MIESFKQGPRHTTRRLNQAINEINRSERLADGICLQEAGTPAGRVMGVNMNAIRPRIANIPGLGITGPTVWYLFNTGEAVDVTGHGFNGAFGGGANADTDAAFFDGDGDYVDCNDALAGDFLGAGSTTVMGWLMPYASALGNQGRLISNGKFEIYILGVGMVRCTSDGDVTKAATPIMAVFPGQWKHICVTRETTKDASGNPNGSKTNIYINGKLSGTADQSSGIPVVSTSNVLIGNNPSLANDYHGLIDDVRVYSGILPAATIKQICQSSINKTYQHCTRVVGGVHIFKVASNATGDGVYNCTFQQLDATDWDDTTGAARFDNYTAIPVAVFNVTEHDCEATYVRHLVAGDLICGWAIVDDEGTQRWVGLPIQTADGNRSRVAYCKNDAGASNTITCYLDKDATGTEITAYALIAQGGTKLNEAFARLKDGDPVVVQKLRYDAGGTVDRWVIIGSPFIPSEDCVCS